MNGALRALVMAGSLALCASGTFCATTPPPSTIPPPELPPPAPPQPFAITDPTELGTPIAAAAIDASAAGDTFLDPMTPDKAWAPIEPLVEQTIAEGKLPGAVVVIGTRDEILYKKAFGSRSLVPVRSPMTLDTVFDLASLTKAVATTSSMMVLVDRGVVSLDEPAARYVPELARANKDKITVRQLLLHTGGFVPDNPLSDFDHGPEEAFRRMFDAPARWPAGERLVYSDVGFMMLGAVVARAGEKDLATFAHENVFQPLGMNETTFVPPPELRARAAPTEVRDGGSIIGEVHDPRAYALGGVAGHAGLFSTPRDLTRFAQTWLNHGEAKSGVRVVKRETFDRFITPHDVPTAVRALGWDMMTPTNKNRGDGFSWHAFGHGGFTGTLLWIDPEAGFFFLFLSNRVHPNGKGAAAEVQQKIGTLVAQVLSQPNARIAIDTPCDRSAAGGVLTGIDVLKRDQFGALRGKKIALLTNGSARTKDGARTIDALAKADGVSLVRIFSPEHGLGADKEGAIADGVDVATGLPVVSLYGATPAPPPDTLEGLDALLVDLPDVGVRFYTYAGTMRRAMRAAAEAHVRVVILDRPNPIDGVSIAGPIADPPIKTGAGYAALPVRHGMTLGELARMFDAEDHAGGDLRVVRAEGWRRADALDATGLAWVAPSPNLRNVTEAILYPGVALVEGTNVSVGRGTDTPFEIVGAPFIDGAALAKSLGERALPGVKVSAISFTPDANPYRGERCGGVRFTITDRAHFDPVRTGLALVMSLRELHAKDWHFDDVNRLLANRATMSAIAEGKSLADVTASWERELASFRSKREKYLLYRTPATCR